MVWPFGRRGAVESRDYSISDPALAEVLGLSITGDAGVSVTPTTAMGVTAVYRAVSLIAGTMAGLPLHTYRDSGDLRERVPSLFDDPGRLDGMTRFEWGEWLMTSLLLHGNAFHQLRENTAGELIGLTPIHPQAVEIEVSKAGLKTFKVKMASGTKKTFGPDEILHTPALSTDGVRGLSPVQAMRQAVGTAIAGDKAAARLYGSGLRISGMVTAEEDLPKEELAVIVNDIREKAAGAKNAGEIVGVNRSLKFTPWTMTAKDAELLPGRQFSVVEVARAYGLPPILLSDSTNTTSWGQGVQEVVRGTAKFTLRPWAARIEQRLSRLLPEGQFVEFDFAGLLQGNQQEVTANLIAEINAGLLTRNEARRILNRPPLDPEEGGDDGQV